MRYFEKGLELLFPSSLYCLCCGKYTDGSRSYSLCDHCIRHISFEMEELLDEENQSCFSSAAAAMGYGLYERQIIFGLKYAGKTYIAGHAADILWDCLRKNLAEEGVCPWLKADVIVPVPVHPSRMKERGFNQAEKIGRHLGRRAGIRVVGDGLLRTRQTTAQRALSAEERRENMRGAFCINPARKAEIRGKRVLLIDDIYTTGATALSCGACLKEGGASAVDFLSLCSAKNRDHSFADLQNEADRW